MSFKILTATNAHLESLSKCFRRCQGDPRKECKLPLEEDFCATMAQIEEDQVLCLLTSGRVIGFLRFSHRFSSYFFPGISKQKEANDLLESLGYQGEEIIVLESLCIDPAYQKRGFGKILLRDFLARKEGASFFAGIPSSCIDALPFFAKMGFVAQTKIPSWGKGDEARVVARMARQSGLCRNLFW